MKPFTHDPENVNTSSRCKDNDECSEAVVAATRAYTNPADAWFVGNVVRYIWRAPHGGVYVEDLKNAQNYLNKLIEKIDKETTNHEN